MGDRKRRRKRAVLTRKEAEESEAKCRLHDLHQATFLKEK